MRIAQVKFRQNSRKLTAPVFAALALGFASAIVHAQVSLTTVVELAQKNSTTVKLADADLQKAKAALGQTEDAYIPNFVIGSQIGYSHGFPTGQPSVGNASMQSLVLSFSQRQYTKAARAGVEAANSASKGCKGAGCSRRLDGLHRDGYREQRDSTPSGNRNRMRRVLSPLSSSALMPASIRTALSCRQS